MALGIFDRVKETTTVTGTGTATLLGAATGYQSFAVVGNGNTTYYCIAGQGTSEWEVGIGTYTSAGTTLARTTVLASSNAGALVTFSAGTKDVFVTYPGGKAIYLDASGNATALGTPASGTLTNCTGLPYSGLTGTVPTWNQNTTGTAAGLSATLAISSGGTNSTATPTAGGAGYGTGTAHAYTAAGTSGNALISAGTGAPAFGNLALGTANTNVSGTLTVTNGGTGVATLSGIAFGNATSAFTAATGAQISTALGSTNISGNAANVTGTVAVGNGGTGATTLTANGVVYGNGTSAVGVTAAGTTGQVLIATTGAAPSWGTAPASGVTSLAGTANQITASASTGAVTLSIPSAFTAPGSITATTTVTGTTLLATQPFIVNSKTVTVSYSIPSGSSAMSAGPITVNSGITVTVPSGSKWVVL